MRWAGVAKGGEGVRCGLGREEGAAVGGVYAYRTALRPSPDLAVRLGALEESAVWVAKPSMLSEPVELCRRGEACDEAAAEETTDADGESM